MIRVPCKGCRKGSYKGAYESYSKGSFWGCIRVKIFGAVSQFLGGPSL